MIDIKIPNALIQNIYNQDNVLLDVLREDLNHPLIQGNKFRKLKYNLLKAKEMQKDTLLTFGGAYSNHIHATAAAGKVFGFKTIGIIRGDELANKTLNPTLREAQEIGIQLKLIKREKYRELTQNNSFDEVKAHEPQAYLLPKGGTNALAFKGCEEILYNATKSYD